MPQSSLSQPLDVTLDLPTPAATDRLGRLLGHVLATGDIVALSGDLGAGKSALSRAAIRHCLKDPEAEVPSPTFTLIQTYETADLEIWHVDLYRLDGGADAVELGLEEAFAEAACLIEWPDRLGDALPVGHLSIDLQHQGEGRRARIAGPAEWRDRLQGGLEDV